jgi:2,4-dienoyl-CoA reductase-like NADH-dependent reductase (Old Yellow Enzyme family)
MQCDPEVTPRTVAPSAIDEPFLKQPAQEITESEIETTIQAYGQAARRAKEAGFDGVQIHAAHGYLISQFLSPYTNNRNDKWGGDFQRRIRFLSHVCQTVREQVGSDYPVFIKLGMMDGIAGGLSREEGAHIISLLDGMGLDAVEISGGIGGKHMVNVRKGIRSEKDEAYFLQLARQARPLTRLPILLVGGFRSRVVMERVLAEGNADFISLCRPLISEPDLPKLMRLGLKTKSRCISSNNCWAEGLGVGIACKCPLPNKEK